MTTRWDNIQILRAIDERQARVAGAAIWQFGYALMTEIAGVHSMDETACAGFIQELHIARDAGLLTFRVQQTSPGHFPDPRQNASHYLHNINEIALTVAGQDRARGRVVTQEVPDPSEDDGRPISQIVLRQVAATITDEYGPDQVALFLDECGLPTGRPPLLAEVPPGDVYANLVALIGGASEGRRMLRLFLGRWISNQYLSGPDDDLRKRLIDQLARGGWHLQDGNLVVGDSSAMPRPGSPTFRDARLDTLHPEVRAAAATYVRDGHTGVAVFEAIKAFEERLRSLTRASLDGSKLVNSALSEHSPQLVVADLSTETGRSIQNGVRSLAAGMVLALRNQGAHLKAAHLSDAETFEQLGLVSMLMRHLDNARKP